MAGSLKRELKIRHGIKPKMRHLYHELDVFVNGERAFSYRQFRRIPTLQDILEAIEAAAAKPALGSKAD